MKCLKKGCTQQTLVKARTTNGFDIMVCPTHDTTFECQYCGGKIFYVGRPEYVMCPYCHRYILM